MRVTLRSLIRRLLGVERAPTYYLPWLSRAGLDCTLILSNVEARFMEEHREGSFPLELVQHAASGAVVTRYAVTLPDSVTSVELPLEPGEGGCGFVTVDAALVHSDLYVTLSAGDAYAATHGRNEFVERYPLRTRLLVDALGHLLALGGRTLPAFTRHQYVYTGPEHRSHVLLMNLSNVTNRIRVSVTRDGRPAGAHLRVLPPMGSEVLDVRALDDTAGHAPTVLRLRLQGNAWFNLYLVGAGPGDLAGALSLMHVK